MGIAFVQSPADVTGSGTTVSQSLASNATATNALVAFATTDPNTTCTFSSTGDSWTTVTPFFDTGAGQLLAIGYAVNITGGAKTVTATFGATGSFLGIRIAEYSGVATASPLDTNTAGVHNTTGTTTPTDSSMTTTVDGDLILSMIILDTLGATITAGSGFTLLGTNSIGMGSEYQIQSTHGAIASTFTLSSAAANAMQSVALKAAGTTATLPPQRQATRRPAPMRVSKTRLTSPVPPQAAPVQEIVQARRQRGMQPRRAKAIQVVPPQFNPPFPWAEIVQSRRQRGLLLRRGKSSETVRPQVNPPFPFAEVVQPRRVRGLLPRRAKPIEVVQPQVTFTNPAYPWFALRARVKSYLIDRGRISQSPVPPQFNPPFPWVEVVQARRQRGLLLRRGKQALPVPVQDGPIPEVVQPRRLRGVLLRRGKAAQPIPVQDGPIAEAVQPRRQRGLLLRRGRQAQPVPPQVNPPYPFDKPITSRQKLQRPMPRGRQWAPPWAQAINPIPFRDAIWSFGNVVLKWVLNVVQNGRWKTGYVQGLKWRFGDVDRSKWSFGLAVLRWTIGGFVVPNPDIPLSSLSLEYVRVPVSATINGAAVNPTGDTVKMAFLQGVSTLPQTTDWKTASWDTVSANGTYFAQCLVGPSGAITLAAGTWYVWIQITDNPEVPVRQVGVLQVV